MSRRHALAVAAMFALAAVIGFTALSRTVQLGSASRHANDALVVSKTKQLNAFERSLHRQLAAVKKAQAPAAAATTVPKLHTPRVVYVRPAPIVVHKHRAGGEGEVEHEGGGFDD